MPFPVILLLPALAVGFAVASSSKRKGKSGKRGWTWVEDGAYFFSYPDFTFHNVYFDRGNERWFGIGIRYHGPPQQPLKKGWHDPISDQGYGYIYCGYGTGEGGVPCDATGVKAVLPPPRTGDQIDPEFGIFGYEDAAGRSEVIDIESIRKALYSMVKVDAHAIWFNKSGAELVAGDCISDEPRYCYKIHADSQGLYSASLLGPEEGGHFPGVGFFTSYATAVAWSLDTLVKLRNLRDNGYEPWDALECPSLSADDYPDLPSAYLAGGACIPPLKS